MLEATGMLLVIAAAVVLLLMISIMVSYNRFVRLEQGVKNSFSTVDVYLKKRYDMIPNLVSVVKGSMAHEQKMLEQLTQASRQQYEGNLQKTVQSEFFLSAQLAEVMILAKKQPQLQQNNEFLYLMEAIENLEKQIAAGRRAYNASVTRYNEAISVMPAAVLAKIQGRTAYPVFTAAAEERQNVQVAL